MTLKQLKARVAARRGFAHYKVLDDIMTVTDAEKKAMKHSNAAKYLF